MSETIDEIIAEDAIGGIYAAQDEVRERFAELQQEYPEVVDAVQKVRDESPQGLGVDISTEEGLKTAVNMMGIDLEQFRQYLALGQKMQEKMYEAIDLDSLKEEGKKALSSVAEEVTVSNFPSEMPFMVYYTADWCQPCAMIKPTIAALAPHLSVPFYFSEDSELRTAEVIISIPRLVMYTEEGKVHGYPWTAESTEELWDLMNGLVNSSGSYEGVGLFECKDGVCGVVPFDPLKS